MADVAVEAPVLAADAIGTIGARLGRKLVEMAARAPDRVLGPSRPLVDPGRPIEALEGDLGEIVAAGFGIEMERVNAAIRTGDFGILESMPVPTAEVDTTPDALDHLSLALDSVLEQLTNDVLPQEAPPRRPPSARAARAGRQAAAPEERGRSALQRLLREAARRARQQEEE